MRRWVKPSPRAAVPGADRRVDLGAARRGVRGRQRPAPLRRVERRVRRRSGSPAARHGGRGLPRREPPRPGGRVLGARGARQVDHRVRGRRRRAGAHLQLGDAHKAGQAQESVWTFEIGAAAGGCVLVHRFRMGTPTEGIRGITADMDAEGKERSSPTGPPSRATWRRHCGASRAPSRRTDRSAPKARLMLLQRIGNRGSAGHALRAGGRAASGECDDPRPRPGHRPGARPAGDGDRDGGPGRGLRLPALGRAGAARRTGGDPQVQRLRHHPARPAPPPGSARCRCCCRRSSTARRSPSWCAAPTGRSRHRRSAKLADELPAAVFDLASSVLLASGSGRTPSSCAALAGAARSRRSPCRRTTRR